MRTRPILLSRDADPCDHGRHRSPSQAVDEVRGDIPELVTRQPSARCGCRRRGHADQPSGQDRREARQKASPVFSPDGSRIAFIAAGGQLADSLGSRRSAHGRRYGAGGYGRLATSAERRAGVVHAGDRLKGGSKATSTVLVTAHTPRVIATVAGTSYMVCDLATGHWRHLFTNDDQPNDEGYLDLDLDKTAVAGLDYVAYGAVQTFDVKGDMERLDDSQRHQCRYRGRWHSKPRHQ